MDPVKETTSTTAPITQGPQSPSTTQKVSALFGTSSSKVINVTMKPLRPADTKAGLQMESIRPKELSEKDGRLWRCVGKVVGPDGKNSFVFKLRADWEKIPNPFPASDTTPNEAEEFSAEREKNLEQKIAEAKKKNRPFGGYEEQLNEIKCFRRLGCDYEKRADGIYMTKPDAEAINFRWKELQKENPGLSGLSVSSEENDQDSLSFSEAYGKHDAYLGQEEFNHDWDTHLLPVIKQKLNVENYDPNIRALFKKNITTFNTIIRNGIDHQADLKLPPKIKEKLPAILNVIKTGVGVYADNCSAAIGYAEPWGEILLNQGMDKFIEHTSGGIGLWVPTYNLKGQNVTLEEVRVVWQAMMAMRK